MSPEDHVRTYAKAFFEIAMERWLGALQLVADKLVRDPAVSERLENRETDLGPRQAILDRLLPQDADLPVRNFLYTLLQRGDLYLLPEIITDLKQRLAHGGAQGPQQVEVVTALPLTETECQTLQVKLEQQFGSGLDVRYRVDPAILGGMIIQAGDKLIDGSVATRLAHLRQALGVTGDNRR